VWLRYELGMIVERATSVMVHGRYIGWAEKPLVAVDIFRVRNGKLVEHWDVMQEEVPASATASAIQCSPFLGEQQGRTQDLRFEQTEGDKCNSR